MLNIKTIYGDEVMNHKSGCKWYCEFENDRISVHDDQWSERYSIVADELVEKIVKAVRDNRRLTLMSFL